MAAKHTHPSLPSAHPALAGGLLLLGALGLGALGLGGCQPSAPPAPTATAPTTEPATTQPTPTNAPGSVAAQPNGIAPVDPPATTADTLPNTLLKEWQPLSNVLVAFGSMTLTPDQVQWGSGQASPYTLVSTEGGYLLKLAANPGFYDTPTTYIKLIPKTDANGASTAMEVAFYTDDSQLLKQEEYIMYGSYFDE